jgi:hypothetical protein
MAGRPKDRFDSVCRQDQPSAHARRRFIRGTERRRKETPAGGRCPKPRQGKSLHDLVVPSRSAAAPAGQGMRSGPAGVTTQKEYVSVLEWDAARERGFTVGRGKVEGYRHPTRQDLAEHPARIMRRSCDPARSADGWRQHVL